MKQHDVPGFGREAGRRIAGHAQEDHLPDPYQRHAKLHEPSVCPQCRAVYHEGRWRWAPVPAGAEEALCAACLRVRDKLPAGIVVLTGLPAGRQRDEMIHLARNQEETENKEHPMNRIMNIAEDADGVSIETTDIHLPRRIGEAVKRALHGKLEAHFDENSYFVRVNWHKD